MVLTDEIWAVLEPAARMSEGFTKDDLEKGIKGHQCFLFTKNKSACVCIKIKNTLRIALGGGDMDDVKDIVVDIEEFAKKTFNYLGLDFKKYVKIDRTLIRKSKTRTQVADNRKAKNTINFYDKNIILIDVRTNKITLKRYGVSWK